MYMIICTCGREYNADRLIRCPGCSKLTQELAKEASPGVSPRPAGAPAVRPMGGMSDDMGRRILSELQSQSSMLRMIRNIAVTFSLSAALLFFLFAILTWQVGSGT